MDPILRELHRISFGKIIYPIKEARFSDKKAGRIFHTDFIFIISVSDLMSLLLITKIKSYEIE